jgi:long-chain acyl-CoA synthetase
VRAAARSLTLGFVVLHRARGLFGLSIHWPIIRKLISSPTRIAVVDDRRSYKAAELLVGAMHIAAAVKAKSATSTLGVMTPTSGAFPMAVLAGWALGKTVVPLNYLLKKEELQYVVDDCGTDTIVTSRAMLDYLKEPPRAANMIVLEDLDFSGVPEPIWPAGAADEDLGVLLYTSGTSGRPKGVMLTHGNISENLRQIIEWVNIDPGDVIVGVLPQFHTFGLTVLTLLPLIVGMKVAYTARFVPHKVIKLIREHRPTVFVAIPSMYGALLSAKDAGPADFESMRLIVSGGEPLPDAVFTRFFDRFGVRITEGYGLTETAPVTNWCRPSEWKLHSVGMPLPEVTERVADLNTGRIMGVGEEGEVQIAGPNVMRGYYHMPQETAATFTADGFFKTGDIGRFDEDGHLFITGRLKEMLIIGGENVFPREIEEVLNQHEIIGASGVVGKKDPMRGELPVAFVELREGVDKSRFDEKALQMFCRGKLAGYKVPDEIRLMETLPRNPTGKVMRRELKKLV